MALLLARACARSWSRRRPRRTPTAPRRPARWRLQVRKSLAENSRPGGLLHVLVHVARLDIHPAPALAPGQQLLAAAAPALELRHHLRHLRVADGLEPALAALGLVVEGHHVALHGHVALAHRRDPVGVVLLGVVLRADPEEAAVEQPRGAGQRALARHAVARQVPLDALAQTRQTSGRSPPSTRTSRGRGARASGRGSGTACGPRRRCRWPGCGPSGRGRPTRPPRPGGSPARGCAPAPRAP